MKTTREAARKVYFEESGSWAEDRARAASRMQRIAWGIAGAMTLVAVCEALVLVFLMPLKTVEPYTLMVDRQTGYVQALKAIDPPLLAADTALTQSFLVQYVIAREGFDANSTRSDYRKVALWSAGAARSSYVAAMRSGPDGALADFTRATRIDVEVKSVTAMGRNVALVRFDTVRTDGGSPRPSQAYAAIIRYTYSTAPMSTADRFINPLGFQARDYRRSIEVLPRDKRGTAEPSAPPGAMPNGSAPYDTSVPLPAYPGAR